MSDAVVLASLKLALRRKKVAKQVRAHGQNLLETPEADNRPCRQIAGVGNAVPKRQLAGQVMRLSRRQKVGNARAQP